MAFHLRFVAAALLWLSAAMVAAQEAPTMSAPNKADYCFYAIYSSMSSFTFLGATSTSTNSSSSSSSHGSSSSGTHGGHRRRSLQRRGHHGGSSNSGYCTATVEVMSLYASAKHLCNKEQLDSLETYWSSLCTASSYTLMDLTGIKANATDAYVKSLANLDPETASTTTTIETPVVLKKSYYERAYKTYIGHDFAIPKDIRYGWGLLGYWCAVLALGMVHKAWTWVFTTRRESTVAASHIEDKGSSTDGTLNKVCHSVRTHVGIAAGLGPAVNNNQELWAWQMIPQRVDLLIILGFWALAIILSFSGYDTFVGNISTPSTFQQNWQYSSDRTGVLSYACLPLVWLFGQRNNAFLWATSFSFRSFTLFHRHLSVVATVLAVVHSINYTVVFMVYDGRYDSGLEQKYFYMGIVATCAMGVMVALSHAWIRMKFYEFFLVSHIVLAALIIYSLICHTSYDAVLYNPYIWTLVGVWALDRAVRIARIVLCNLRIKFGRNLIQMTSTTVEYSEQSDMLTISTYPAANALLRAGPGQFYYIYQPFNFIFWQSHPFSLASYRQVPSSKGKPSDLELSFIVRPYNGWTRMLRGKCRESGLQTIKVPMMLEGPYGHASPMHLFDTVLMIVGGTGIAAAMPYLIDHVERSAKGSTRTTKIKLFWSSRTAGMIQQLVESDLTQVMQRTDFESHFYATSGAVPVASSSPTMSSSARDEEDEKKAPARVHQTPLNGIALTGEVGSDEPVASYALAHAGIKSGRPDIRAAVRTVVEEAKASSSRVAVFVCGPGKMADESRDSVYEVMRGGFGEIEYIEECFAW